MDTSSVDTATVDLSGEWLLRYLPPSEKQVDSSHPPPSPDLLARLQEGVKVRVPCDVHSGQRFSSLHYFTKK